MAGIDTTISPQTASTTVTLSSVLEVAVETLAISSAIAIDSGFAATVETCGIATTVTAPVANYVYNYDEALPDGTDDGDIVRWNASLGAWEVKSEPLAFGQIILTPREEALLNQEGSLWYKSTEKAVFVCTDDV